MSADDFFQAERLLDDGDAPGAVGVLERLLAGLPEHVAGWRLYAHALEAAGRTKDAAEAARRGDAVEAEHIADVGASLLFHGDEKRAEGFFRRALALDDDCLNAHWLMGDVLSRQNRREDALGHYRRCREIAPERTGPAFMIAALGAEASPEAAPRDYVVAFFDWYADHFDEHLTGNLNYRGPELVADAVRHWRANGGLRVVDLGCGTGLSGVALQDLAVSLIGVDLSPEMLERARARGIYDTLVEADLRPALEDLGDGSADLVAAVDVLVYVGELEPLLPEIFRVLAPGGAFVATFEAAAEEEGACHLMPSGRFRLAASYLDAAARAAGFTGIEIAAATLREERGAPVESLIARFVRPE